MVYQSQSDVEHVRGNKGAPGGGRVKNIYVFDGRAGGNSAFPLNGEKVEQRAIIWNGGETPPCISYSGRQSIRESFRYDFVNSLNQIQPVKHNVPCSFGIGSDREIG